MQKAGVSEEQSSSKVDNVKNKTRERKKIRYKKKEKRQKSLRHTEQEL